MKKSFLAIAVLLVVAAVVTLLLWNQITKSNISDSDRAVEAITKEFPNFSSEQGSTISIDSVKRYEGGWYIATIKPAQPVEVVVPVKVLLFDQYRNGENLKVVLGPDVYFSKRETLIHNLPESVIIDLEKQ